MATFKKSFEAKLIYVYRINDTEHEGVLKIGEASCQNAGLHYYALEPNCKILNDAAKERIRHQTQTAGVRFELLHTEITAYQKGKELRVFQDHEIHDILKRSNIKQKFFDEDNDGHKANEWFYTDLETVKKAITAAKEGRTSLNASEISKDKSPIVFRPEQLDAINKTLKQFTKKNSSNKMLWNAKMRFGKTLTALQVIKKMNFNRTLILTHRPVVDKGWFEDYTKIFYDRDDFEYCSKKNGGNLSSESDFYEKLFNAQKNGLSDFHFIYFASIQDMRGSEIVGGKFSKNEEIFNIDWDFIIIDEAHEGTQTELGKSVIAKCKKSNTKILHLSGTPFNLMDDFEEDEIYTWDYVMEQNAKEQWEKFHQGDPNPYGCLPRLNIFTYNLGLLYPEYIDDDIAFNFREFFRVGENEKFIHEENVKQFLDLLTKEDAESNYPFSKAEYRENFRHSLWMIPGVKEARALSKLLQAHSVFGQFAIANVAGDGDEEEDEKEALKKVEKAIGPEPENSYSITLSCGRLTTGVSVKPWTACFMLSGSYSTAASTYMQTIFRVQTPAIIGGKQKEECFVFDFAPDRTLKVIAETAKVSRKAGNTTQNDRIILGEFLNFCPIIGFEGSKMIEYDTPKMLEQLKKVYVERVVNNGFEDGYLYNNDLLKLTDVELKEFENLKKIIGTTKAMAKTGQIEINNQGLTEEEFEKYQPEPVDPSPVPPKQPTEDELKRKAELERAKKNRDAAVSILRGISIRMPLMIYGADLNKNLDGTEDDSVFSIDNFTTLIDDLSWKEFMPNGVTKQKFNKFKKYYDKDVFHAASVRIRQMAKAADNLTIEERIERISMIFNTFRNPDKETVLTPWRVVNMHLTDTLGGWCFYDQEYKNILQKPVFVEHEGVTKNVYKKNAKILEINSKSGLYALFCAYSIYKAREKLELGPAATKEMQKALWQKVLNENIYVICKTPMAKAITKRTLAGFTESKINAHSFDDLVMQLKEKPDNFIEKVTRPTTWKKEGSEKMKFDAIVGNPPYQEMDGGNGTSAGAVYNLFVEGAKKLEPNYISMIMPARWYAGGKGLDDFRDKMLNDKKIKTIIDFPNCNDLFPSVDIAGGLCYFLRTDNENDNCIVKSMMNGKSFVTERNLNEYDIFIRDNRAVEIIKKVNSLYEKTLENIVSSRKPFGLPTNYEPKENGVPCHFIQKIGKKFADKKDIVDSNNLLDKWKFIAPKAPIAGQTDFTKPVGFYYDGNTKIAKPGECCTESFIVLGGFDTEEEVLNFKSYIMTKTVRFLLLQAVVSQDVTKKCFCFVPDLISYKEQYTDQKLCQRWNITQEEWAYIDSRICNIKSKND